jgi:hypothetical protein
MTKRAFASEWAGFPVAPQSWFDVASEDFEKTP